LKRISIAFIGIRRALRCNGFSCGTRHFRCNRGYSSGSGTLLSEEIKVGGGQNENELEKENEFLETGDWEQNENELEKENEFFRNRGLGTE
jgi:hypothetical protein